jgi:hypothetical protein
MRISTVVQREDLCTFEPTSSARARAVLGGPRLRVRLSAATWIVLALALVGASSGCVVPSSDEAPEAQSRTSRTVASNAAQAGSDASAGPRAIATPESDASCDGRGLTACRAEQGIVCVDLLRDSANCGACGRRCRGGTCSEGHCESCSVEVGPGENWECQEGSACSELHCPGMDTRPGRPLLVHFSGTVDGERSAAVTLALFDASGHPVAIATCGSSSRPSSADCVLPSPTPGQSPTLVVPPDGTVRVRLSGACGRPGTCRIESGSVLRIFRP